MALLKIESGEVTRHVGTNGAFAVAEMVNLPDGRSFPKTYTVWADNAPEIGSIVSVVGVMSAKVREYQAQGETRHAADVSINDPEVNILGTPGITATPEEAVTNVQEVLGGTEVPF
jgi:hypothetical protein